MEPIQYVAKPNRVDFKHLKEVMLAVILDHIEGKVRAISDNTLKVTHASYEFIYKPFPLPCPNSHFLYVI